MKLFANISLIFFVLILCSCRNESKKVVKENDAEGITKGIDIDDRKLEDVKEQMALAINQGDTAAYNLAHIFLAFDAVDSPRLFHFAMLMSNKYNYHKASFDVFNILRTDAIYNDINLKLEDKFSKKMMRYYLMKYYLTAPTKMKNKNKLKEYFDTNKELPTLNEILCD